MRRGCTGAQCAWRLWCEGQRSRRELLIPCASILLLPSDGCPQACAEAYLLASRKARANTSRGAVALFSRAHDPAKAPFRPVYPMRYVATEPIFYRHASLFHSWDSTMARLMDESRLSRFVSASRRCSPVYAV